MSNQTKQYQINLTNYNNRYLDEEGIEWVMASEALEEYANLKKELELKPNQEVVTWHDYPDEKPNDFGWFLIKDDCGIVDIAKYISESVGFYQQIGHDVSVWAYLPKGVRSE